MIAGLPSEQEGVSDTEARYWWDKVLSDETKRKFIVSLLKDKERQKDYYILTSTPFDEFKPKIKARLKLWLVNSDSKDLKAKKGILLKGKRHYEGGIPVEVEDGEMIINRKSGKIKDRIICEGTGEGIGSALNELGGGVKWSNEGKCKVEKMKSIQDKYAEFDRFDYGDKVKMLIGTYHYPKHYGVVKEITKIAPNEYDVRVDIYNNEDDLISTDIYPFDYLVPIKEKGGITKAKAKKILHDGEIKGKPLTEKQRKFFGARASGYPEKAEEGALLSENKKYKVLKIFRKSGRRQVLEKNLTEDEARRVVNRFPSSKTSMVVYTSMEKGGKIKSHISSKMKIKNKIKEGNYELGGYAGKTQEEIWNNWTNDQRRHFLYDHSLDENFRTDDYEELPEHAKQQLKGHTMMGQYENGGLPKVYLKINEPKEFEILEFVNPVETFRLQKVLKTGDILIMENSESLQRFLDGFKIHYTVFDNKDEIDSWLVKQLPNRIKNTLKI